MFCYSNPQNKNTNSGSRIQPPKTSFNQTGVTGSGDALATKSQLDYIYKNNLDVNTKNLTKKEAWAIIKKQKEDKIK